MRVELTEGARTRAVECGLDPERVRRALETLSPAALWELVGRSDSCPICGQPETFPNMPGELCEDCLAGLPDGSTGCDSERGGRLALEPRP